MPADINTSRCAIGFVGTSAQIVEYIHPFIELGVDYFMLDCGGVPKLITRQTLINEVLSAWND